MRLDRSTLFVISFRIEDAIQHRASDNTSYADGQRDRSHAREDALHMVKKKSIQAQGNEDQCETDTGNRTCPDRCIPPPNAKSWYQGLHPGDRSRNECDSSDNDS